MRIIYKENEKKSVVSLHTVPSHPYPHNSNSGPNRYLAPIIYNIQYTIYSSKIK